MAEKELVEAPLVMRTFGIPRSTLYRLVDQGKIRAVRLPRSQFHQRRRLLFNLDEVRDDLARLPKPKP